MYLVKSSSNKGYTVRETRYKNILLPPPLPNAHSPCWKEHEVQGLLTVKTAIGNLQKKKTEPSKT